ncbi:NAD(P)-dependent dehydrogenase (short-subunit alcohol dehydrogenase family) [Halarchaeum solikamskense]|uniref:SDR family NAD(P)-dependent oxidoreductase n=1 Tax=Halarchaeum nitratireducens TaxID=489913 RepID=UPI001B3AD9D5|nr:SDR family NAD(P)-dependent oxidoreductase [Halarchaeum solikamskense]MBP2252448.1 NAD(P)-dependent dehydrogenase (short-subunit alcohol dehydrogenase family) [Halarchaeum solikamskense]
MERLADRVALITGASSGIGNAIAAAFGREGASVVIADVRREPKLDDERSVFDRLDDVDADYAYVETDVSDEAAVETAVETAIDEFGGLDVLVNNAGIYQQYPVHETPTDAWDAIVDVNLRGVYLGSKAALPHLAASEHGKVINLASIYGLVGGSNSAAYCASKGGVANLTRQMAIDYADDRVNVNALAPGIIKTAQNAEWRANNPEIISEWETLTPWPGFGEPEDVADAAIFLASSESDFITGHVLSVDGGWTAQ